MIISEIKKSTGETILIQTTEFKDSRYVDIRIYVQAADGQLVPTKKGITLSRAIIGEVIAALETTSRGLE